MTTNNIKNILRTGLVGCGMAAALTACTDTWDEHYEGTVNGIHEGTLWQAIQQNPDLSNFASVIQATGYDKSLASSQVFTVFAPTNANFSQSEANDLIAQYRQQKGVVNDDDNTVVKEFVQNHIALYNFSVSPTSNDSIVLMNGKYAMLRSDAIDNSSYESSNQLYGNGVLFTVGRPIDFSANVFEYLRKDADLDSVRSFLYNPLFYYKKFNPSASVEGGIDDLGRTIYLDSVFNQRNDLFNELGILNSEDSVYWMLAPTNEQWAKLYDEYKDYFNYPQNVDKLLTVGDRDSLVYVNIGKAILQGATFSQTTNRTFTNGARQNPQRLDSVYAVGAVIDYNSRSYRWGANFNYYQYFGAFLPDGILAEADSTACSNGRVMKVHDWKIDKLQTFHRWKVIEGEGAGNLREIGKYESNTTTHDSTQLATALVSVVDNPRFRGRVFNNRYVRFTPSTTNLMWDATFNITQVLSNIGYDIYLVTVPYLATDSNTVDTLQSKFRVNLVYTDGNGKRQSHRFVEKDVADPTKARASSSGIINNSGTSVDYILLAEDFKFPLCTYGIRETDPIVSFQIENRTTNSEVNQGRYTKNIGVDCILLVPHGTLQLVDDNPFYPGEPAMVAMPHGDHLWQYMFRR